MKILRADERFCTEQAGIVSWHCFSAGPHYDADNLSFGPVMGVDDHVLAPGAGFDEHAHRGVDIWSFVVSGILAHSGPDGYRLVAAGETFTQDAGAGIRHVERNGGDEPLRLIQTTLLTGAGVEFEVLEEGCEISATWLHVFVVGGSWRLDESALEQGDSARLMDDSSHRLVGAGRCILLRPATG